MIAKFANGDLSRELQKIMGYDEHHTTRKTEQGSVAPYYTIEVNDNTFTYTTERERNLDYGTLRAMIAIKKVTGYSWADERKNVEEYIHECLGEEEGEKAEAMSDAELFNEYHDQLPAADHIWFWLYSLNQMNPYPEA